MKIIDRKNLMHTQFMDLNETTYEDKLGNNKTWVWAQRPYDQQAVVIAATLNDKLVLIKEYRVPIESYIYELPAGLVDPNEYPYDAGCREFEEETGYEFKELTRPMSPLVVNSPGLSDESIFFMFGKAEDVDVKPEHGPSEDIEVLTYSQSEVADLLNEPNVKIGAKAFLIFLKFAEYGTL